ncbi:MAG: bis-aminopropyl spermidine synthase family protein [Nocardiopsaceae bacterium]|nr:bis-aminopropyl spermidine synthase family protein [Nocardiopsaceae bacterium]
MTPGIGAVTLDAAEFRRLLGVAPEGKLAVLGALLAGDCTPRELVAASGLPRRDVEEFIAALAPLGLAPLGRDVADQARVGDAGVSAAGVSAAGARESCRKLLAEYRASRAVVRKDDEADLERAAAGLIASAPAPRKRFDHVQATPTTLVARVKWLTERFDLAGQAVLLLGDHDLTSLLLARVVPDAELTVADIDEDLLAYIDARSAGQHGAGERSAGEHGAGESGAGQHGGGRVRCAWADFRCGLPPALEQSADVVFTDPPYTPEGLGAFLSRSVSALSRRDPGARIVVCYGHSRRRPDLGLAAQREIARRDLVIDAMLPGFSRYAAGGAQAVGSASDLYCLQPAPSAFRRGGASPAAASRHPAAASRDTAASRPSGRHGAYQHGAYQQGIYTRGEQSVESGAPSAADLVPLLGLIASPGAGGPGGADPGGVHPGEVGIVCPDPGAAGDFAVAVSLGKLLADGVHSSVTGRAGQFVADLRDDPGPWLMRAMLALNAQQAVFVVPRRHDALDRLTAGAPEWDLPRAKFARVSQVPVGDLVAVRCVLAPGLGRPADPGLELARYVTRRAHGRLRNVWREGLIAVAAASGKTLAKREAAALVEEHAGSWPAGLPLRLIDIPAARFPSLHAALRASTAAVTGLA